MLKKKRNKRIIFLTQTAVFGAVATIVAFFKVPVFFLPGFYKIDFSQAVVLIGAFALGPVAGIIIGFIKVVLVLCIKGTATFFLGSIANFVMSCAFVVPSSLYYKKNRTLKGAMVGMVLGTVCVAAVAAIVNYFVLLPVYAKIFGISIQSIINIAHVANLNINNLATFIFFAVVPFNLIESIFACAIALLLYKRTSKIIEKVNRRLNIK